MKITLTKTEQDAIKGALEAADLLRAQADARIARTLAAIGEDHALKIPVDRVRFSKGCLEWDEPPAPRLAEQQPAEVVAPEPETAGV